MRREVREFVEKIGVHTGGSRQGLPRAERDDAYE